MSYGKAHLGERLKYPTVAFAAVGAPENPFHGPNLGTPCCETKVRALRRILAEEIQALEDPRLFLLTVEAARLSPDGGLLSVYVEAFRDQEGVLEALAHAERRLASALGRRVRLRRLPRLEFLPWSPEP
jgi:ribosome-binding factor A